MNAHSPAMTPPYQPSDADWQALTDYLCHEASPTDRATIEQRVATEPAFAAFAQPLITAWRAPLAIPARDSAAGWMAIQQQAVALRATPRVPPAQVLHPRRTSKSPRFALRALASRWRALAALCLVAAVGVEVVRMRLYPAYYYQGGAHGANVILPDGSRVTLAPGSYVGTAHGFPTRTRAVYLYGQAHFAVTPNPRVPFLVYVPSVSARVLGTTFTMHADTSPVVRVDVEQGAVALVTCDSAGHWHPFEVLTAGGAAHVPRLEAWLSQAGADIGNAGVPWGESIRIGEALQAAAIRAGAAAARQRVR